MALMSALAMSPVGSTPLWLSVPTPPDPMSEARWIWVRPEGGPNPSGQDGATGTFTFRTEFRAARARLTFTADNVAVVRLNGREVARHEDWSWLRQADLTPWLRTSGVQLLEIQVTNPALGSATVNPGGLIAQIAATDASGRTRRLSSGRSWKAEGGETVELGGFGMGPWNLSGADAPPPAFRREITLRRVPKTAPVEVVGLGHYHLFVNGRQVGNAAVNGPWSQYDRTLISQRFDLAPFLRPGRNVIGVMLGNGFFRAAQPPAGRYTKGDAMPDFSEGHPYRLWMRGFVSTDRSWRWRPGPLTVSHIFAGEDFDARQAVDWDATSGWRPATTLPTPKAKVSPQTFPDLRAHEVFRPVSIAPQPKGGWAYRFPQNCSAMLRFRIRGPRGAKVTFQLSEVILPNGNVEQLNLWGREALTSYTLRGGSPETYQNLFFFHGGQFVGVRGAVPAGRPNPQGLPVLESLELVHVRLANRPVSTFESSSDLANETVKLIDWAMRSNMGYVLMDCPHREKLGWLECAHLLANTFAYRYDCRDWFRKICRDMRDAQRSNGRVLTVAPLYLMRPEDAYAWTVEWGAASVLLPSQAYVWYGDRRFLTENLPMMRRFVDRVSAESVGGIAPGGLGDWYDYGHGQPPGPSRYTDTRLTATAIQAMCLRAVADALRATGSPVAAAQYDARYASVGEAFLRTFYRPELKAFANNGSVQTGSAIALCAGLVPEADRAAVLQGIVDELVVRNYQQTSGDVGHLFLIRALAEGGRSDVLHRVYARTGVGSYGGILAKGLTTMPETWDAITEGSNSLNHCMLGHAMEWYYGYVLGLRQAPGSLGWKRAIIAPVPGAMSRCAGHLDTPVGRYAVSWTASGGQLTVEFSVPKGGQALAAGKTFGPGSHRVSLPNP